jgi:hypothetical protein
MRSRNDYLCSGHMDGQVAEGFMTWVSTFLRTFQRRRHNSSWHNISVAQCAPRFHGRILPCLEVIEYIWARVEHPRRIRSLNRTQRSKESCSPWFLLPQLSVHSSSLLKVIFLSIQITPDNVQHGTLSASVVSVRHPARVLSTFARELDQARWPCMCVKLKCLNLDFLCRDFYIAPPWLNWRATLVIWSAKDFLAPFHVLITPIHIFSIILPWFLALYCHRQLHFSFCSSGRIITGSLDFCALQIFCKDASSSGAHPIFLLDRVGAPTAAAMHPSGTQSSAPSPSQGSRFTNTTVSVNDARISTSGPDWTNSTSSCDSSTASKKDNVAGQMLTFKFNGLFFYSFTWLLMNGFCIY